MSDTKWLLTGAMADELEFLSEPFTTGELLNSPPGRKPPLQTPHTGGKITLDLGPRANAQGLGRGTQIRWRCCVMTITDMNPQTAMFMELIRGLLDLSRRRITTAPPKNIAGL